MQSFQICMLFILSFDHRCVRRGWRCLKQCLQMRLAWKGHWSCNNLKKVLAPQMGKFITWPLYSSSVCKTNYKNLHSLFNGEGSIFNVREPAWYLWRVKWKNKFAVHRDVHWSKSAVLSSHRHHSLYSQ